MRKSNYRNGNETMINYYNKITEKLDEYKFEDLDIVRTETSLFINNDIEHFLIAVTTTHKAPNEDIKRFFYIMEQEMEKQYPKFTKEMKKTHKILVPDMLHIHFKLITAIMKKYGYEMELLQNSARAVIDEGLKSVHNDTCYPALLRRSNLPQFYPKW